jgi:enamine deaminase RidA (YjgF/YER057c/UK114 family)
VGAVLFIEQNAAFSGAIRQRVFPVAGYGFGAPLAVMLPAELEIPGCHTVALGVEMPGKIAARLAELKIELPKAAAPVANYVPVVITGNHAYLSGQITVWNGELKYVGQLGKEFQVEDGQKAARICGHNIIAQLQAALGDLDRVRRCVKLNVFVNSTPNFTDQPKVANGVSDFIAEVFGEAGKHARSAVGVAQLPLGVAVEVDAVFEIS